MTFKAWLLSRKGGDDPRGDFLRDTHDIGDAFPKDFAGWDAFEHYLLYTRGACYETIEEGKKLWDEWERTRVE
jgi:hypothetical protein